MAIQAGNYAVASRLLIAGTMELPVYSFALDLNGYNLVTSFEVRTPIFRFDGSKAPIADFSAQLQKACDTAMLFRAELQLSYESVSPTSTTTQLPTRFLTMETGGVDELQYDFAANELTWICRSIGARLQESRIQGGVPKFQYGHQLVQYFFKNFAPDIALTVVPSTFPMGHSFTEIDYTKTARGQSVWDYVSQIAQDDGYILTVHNGAAYYGPAGGYPGAPTLSYAWGKDLTECRVDHAARRTRNIQVIVTGYNQKRQRRALAIYPQLASNVTEKVFIDARHNHLRGQSAIAFAQQQYRELASKEIVPTISLVPDGALIRALAQYGPHFYVNLDGTLPSIDRPLYHCKQAHLEFNGDATDPSLTAELTIENHNPTSQA